LSFNSLLRSSIERESLMARTRAFSLLSELHNVARARRTNPINADPGKVNVMSAPVIRGLAATIRGAVNDLTKLASDAATELAAEVEEFRSDVADVKDVTMEVRAARADVRAALGQGTNGGPSTANEPSEKTSGAAAITSTSATTTKPNPTPAASEGSPSRPPSASLSQHSAGLPNGRERTPIGVVQR
jgi:hypothetical protein